MSKDTIINNKTHHMLVPTVLHLCLLYRLASKIFFGGG